MLFALFVMPMLILLEVNRILEKLVHHKNQLKAIHAWIQGSSQKSREIEGFIQGSLLLGLVSLTCILLLTPVQLHYTLHIHMYMCLK